MRTDLFKELRLSLRTLKKAFSFALEESPFKFFMATFLSLVQVIIPVITAYLGSRIIDAVVKVQGSTNPYYDNIIYLLSAMIAVAFILPITMTFNDHIRKYLHRLLVRKTDMALIAAPSKYSFEQLEKADFHQALAKGRQNSWRMWHLASGGTDLIRGLLELIVAGCLVFTLYPFLGMFVLLYAIPKIYVDLYAAKSHHLAEEELANSWRRTWDFKYILTASIVLVQVKLLRKTAKLIELLNTTYDNIENRYKERDGKVFIPVLLVSILNEIIYYTTYGLILYKTVRGGLSIGEFTFALTIVGRFQSAVFQTCSAFNAITGQEPFLRELFNLVEGNIEEQISTGIPSVSNTVNYKDQPLTIELNGIRVNRGKRTILSIPHLKIHAGEFLGIVGPIGSGKTTFRKLLTKEIIPDEGTIMLNDGIHSVSLNDIPEDLWALSCRALQQDANIFNSFTIREAILLGQEPERKNLSVEDACAITGAMYVIDKAPEGFESSIGADYKAGFEPSGGEKQMIALTRTILSLPKLLILDEPGAHLDPVMEADVISRITKAFTEGENLATRIIISHRYGTLLGADRILVFDNGVLQDQGSHHDLLLRAGTYQEQYLRQVRELMPGAHVYLDGSKVIIEEAA